MEVHQIRELRPGTPVWVWILRVGKGRWWRGSVLSITALEPFPRIDTRFECRSAGKNGTDGPAFVGITTTRLRFLELRDPNLKGEDQPNFVPSTVFAKLGETEPKLHDIEHLDTTAADDHGPRVVPPPPVKKSRPRKKAKVSNATQNATVVTIET
jgi:hypothetical protein